MLERYTEQARRALFFGRYEADQSGSVSVEGEHLLLALMRDPGELMREIFARSGLSLEDVRQEVERAPRREPGPAPDENRLGIEARRMLQLAAEEADRLLDAAIDTEHILLGILRDERSRAASILTARGMRIEAVRDDIVRHRSERPAPPRLGAPRNRMRPRPPSRPPDLPATPGVHIAASRKQPGEGSETGGDDFWALEGFDLKSALSRVFSTAERLFPESRVELPTSFDPHERYDFFLVLSPGAQHADRNRLMERGIERHFGVALALESRPMDVYVMTVPSGQSAAIRDAPDLAGGGLGAASLGFAIPEFEGTPATPESFRARFPTLASFREALSKAAIGSISISNGTMEGFCQTLEQGLDRPVVDETGLTGRYNIELLSDAPVSTAEFLERLRTRLGLALTPGRRPVTILAVRPATSISHRRRGPTPAAN